MTYGYTDDILSFNNSTFDDYVNRIYQILLVTRIFQIEINSENETLLQKR